VTSPALNTRIRSRAEVATILRARMARENATRDRLYAALTRADPTLTPLTRRLRDAIRSDGGMSPIERLTGVKLNRTRSSER